MSKIPIALIYSRIAIAVFLLASFQSFNGYGLLAVILLAIGVLSDIFDGIIARKLNISTQQLRRLDSTADQIFWVLTAAALFIHYPQFLFGNYIQLTILFAAEGLAYIVSYARFKKEVATHAISSKIWTLILFFTIAEVFLTGKSNVLFQICFYTGLLTHLEIIAILLTIKSWTNDVPSLYHAFLLRKGKSIKRNKLFNG
ncbi:MAG TPA: CDP-alcohol phosphatidyltransferase family protein [Chitinophagaceae bacterium]|nr:CDP-alcohol phosphatidyltransferase family protein [Chitinophagaceae bacterium]